MRSAECGVRSVYMYIYIYMYFNIFFFYIFSTLLIFHTPHFPHSSFSTLRIFHTPHFPHSSFSTLLIFHTPHFPHSSFSTLLIFHTPHFPHSALRTPHSALLVFHLTFQIRDKDLCGRHVQALFQTAYCIKKKKERKLLYWYLFPRNFSLSGNRKRMFETGRYDQTSRINILCPVDCGSTEIEDELYFSIFLCKTIRDYFFRKIGQHLPHIKHLLPINADATFGCHFLLHFCVRRLIADWLIFNCWNLLLRNSRVSCIPSLQHHMYL